ncbi:phosphatidate cytidylyltransferase [uncultured Rhodoferax sp.]|uniref:phosphatidate cytidylyltransferase n=1 Tax=uncultured Rhodoferax sp. TaxID=223188 RepID=UPI0025E02515|nr:phosphatidate cytidylyltransferase [uncultured Rhodoferax sp.]
MLWQRVVTAVLLLAVLLPAVFYPAPWIFACVAVVLIAAGGWEWARLNQIGNAGAWGTGAACALFCLLSLAGWTSLLQGAGLWPLVTAIWVLGGGWMLLRGVGRWAQVPQMLRWVLGVACLCAAWLAVTQARVIGINFLFSVLVLVWAADIGAYFAGRGLGGKFFARKLAPSISPGKTWEGVLGGLVAVVAVGCLWIQADRHWVLDSVSLYSRLWQQGVWFALLALLWLTAWSVVGDLLESLIKRSAGVKDSSGLLPGHGGVLDRLDALLPVLPMAMMLQSL